MAREVDGDQAYTNDPDEVARLFGRSVDVLLDGEISHGEPSSIVDLTGDVPEVVRSGSGDLEWLR